MVKAAQIARGKKWVEVKRVAIFENRNNDVKWMDTQESIVNDIEAYNLSIDPEADISYSDKSKTELKKACKEAGLEYDDTSTKDDLIVLLENKSDEAK